MIKYAAVIPLHYTDERTEFSIILIGDHYNDLVRILTDPQMIFLEEQESNKIPGGIRPGPFQTRDMAFPYDPASTGPKPAFFMKQSITAVIKHGYKLDKDGKAIDYRFKSNAMFIAGLTEKKDRSKFSAQAQNSPALTAPKLQAEYPNGLVYCEFAVNTHCLHIIYYKGTADNGTFDGDVTDVTISTPTVFGWPKDSVGHFDLMDRNPASRASFVGTTLENPDKVIRIVNSVKKHFVAKPDLLERGQGFLSVTQPKTISKPPKVLRDPGVYPDVLIESLSTGATGDNEEVEPCTVWVLEERPPGSGMYYLVEVVVKSYDNDDSITMSAAKSVLDDRGTVGRRAKPNVADIGEDSAEALISPSP